MTAISSRRVASTVGVGVVLLGVGCGDSADSVAAYSADDLLAGVELDLDDPEGIAESAVVFLPDELPFYESLIPRLEADGVAVHDPGDDGLDVLVIYQGAGCGLSPTVALGTAGGRTEMLITSHLDADRECLAMEYHEAVRLELAAKYRDHPITVSSRRCLVQHPDVCTPTGETDQVAR